MIGDDRLTMNMSHVYMRIFICNLVFSLTRTWVQRFRPNDKRRAHWVQRKFLEVITSFLWKYFVNHKSFVAPPGCFQLPGGRESQLGLTVHDVPLCTMGFHTVPKYSSQDIVKTETSESRMSSTTFVLLMHFFLFRTDLFSILSKSDSLQASVCSEWL